MNSGDLDRGSQGRTMMGRKACVLAGTLLGLLGGAVRAQENYAMGKAEIVVIEAIALPLPASRDRALRSNKISPEAQPLQPGLAPHSVGLTFAQTLGKDGLVATLLVAAYDGDAIEAIDLTALGAKPNLDVFDASAMVGETQLLAALAEGRNRARYRMADLLPSGALFDRHLATGTNFPAHASETGSQSVFNFPKFGKPTPARSSLVVHAGTLLDYEVEICVRFDRDIRTVEDFETARKGFFLCGDFTDRALLVRLVDPDNIASGRGFSDSKSGPGYFPTGPFLVIPRDWREFVRNERIVTRVNGEVRQDARGQGMILDFEALVAKAITDGGGGRYTYRGKSVPLIKNGIIPRGAAVMSGTSEGVIFMPPMREDIVGGIIDHILLGRFLSGKPLFFSIGNRFIRNELKAGRYLKINDRLEHASSTMGGLTVELIAP
jgi:2-keto-4-pentenoate hydratase/2-oxohepta-3-ene-1,7-dioic acid hydratase in catechol pathway